MPTPAQRAAVSALLLTLCFASSGSLYALRREPGRQGGELFLSSPPAAPSVLRVQSGKDGLSVRLGLPGSLADGARLPFLPENVFVRSLAPDGSLAAEWSVPLEPDGTLSLSGLPAGRLSLTFSLLAGSVAGLPSAAVHLMAVDPNEPNDSPDKAVALSSDTQGVFAAEGMIDNSLDFDFFSFELQAGDSVSLVLAGLDSSGSALAPALSLLDSSGAVLAHREDSVPLGARVNASGRYLALVADRAFLEGGSFQNAADRFYSLQVRRLNRRGDLDGDGSLSYRDAFVLYFLVRGVLDSTAFSPAQLAAADWDGDGAWLGDYQDFAGLLRQVIPAPARDPDSPGEKSSASLAAVAGERFAFPDGSALRLGPEGGLSVDTPGGEAARFLALTGSNGLSAGVSLPRASALYQNAPNPFNPSTCIRFSLEAAGMVRLEVFDLGGRRVATLDAGERAAGTYSVEWDGRDERGRDLPAGVYLYRLSAGGTAITRKMVLLK
ncbi:T9SS type A sorting domain-containing protein [bacterium]|nr:T9SS type A sorting domain-containing protein [bacterium]